MATSTPAGGRSGDCGCRRALRLDLRTKGNGWRVGHIKEVASWLTRSGQSMHDGLRDEQSAGPGVVMGHAVKRVSVRPWQLSRAGIVSGVGRPAPLRCSLQATAHALPSFFEQPILNSPYERPRRHWELDEGRPTHRIVENRREASFITPIPKPRRLQRGQRQLALDEAAAANAGRTSASGCRALETRSAA